MIKAVLFDFGGVFVPATHYIIKRACDEFSLDRLEIHSLLVHAIPAVELGLPFEDCRKLLEREIRRPVTKAQFTDVFIGEYRRRSRVNPRMLRLARSLGKRYQTALVSNTFEEHAEINRRRGWYKGFSCVALSHELGIRKPNPAIYRYALSVLKRKPQECVFVDDLPENVRAAKKLGMHGIVFQNPTQLKHELQLLGVRA